jgi:hypothetical protein
VKPTQTHTQQTYRSEIKVSTTMPTLQGSYTIHFTRQDCDVHGINHKTTITRQPNRVPQAVSVGV